MDQLVVCGVFNPVTHQSFTVAFVYARNCIVERRRLWNIVRTLAASSPLNQSPWLVVGDFNQVLSMEEVYSFVPAPVSLRGISDFSECLSAAGLFDLAGRGCHFTWSNKSPISPKSRKLDRALVNEEWRQRFTESNAYFDVPGCSDHSPCLVTISEAEDRRRSRFNFFTFFTTHPEYHQRLQTAWETVLIPSDPMISLCQKLKAAKFCCKSINQEFFSDIERRTKEAFEDLESIQRQMMNLPTPELFESERRARDLWLILAAAEECFFRQKSRIRWLEEGDANTAFFYKSVLANLSRNIIFYLLDGTGNRVSDIMAIKAMILDFYTLLLGTSNSLVAPLTISQIRDIHPYRCPLDLETQLIEIPSEEIIRDTVFRLPRNKAPGPDGFTAEFYTSSWELVGSDVITAVKDFFLSFNLPRQVNATVVALIPKVPGAASLTDFRPISLCNTIYKVISRILARKLQLITPAAVQGNQVGFVKGRLLCENVLLASELVANFNREGSVTRGCLQIDISKAYDNVDWRHILNTLHAFELPHRLIAWIEKCISSPHYSIAINGELCGFFPGKKGLRQGDSISSSLFIIAMDILSKKLDEAVRDGRFNPHPLCSDPLITHLSFADDMLIFFDGTESSLRGILEVLKEFELISGLALNLGKSRLFLDGNQLQPTEALASAYGLTQGSLPVRYLGVPLSPSKLKKHDYQPLIDKVLARIKSWTVKRLSFAGRLQLLQTVVYGITNFWSSVFPLPKGCLDRLEQICNAFLWSGDSASARGAKIAWRTVCTPKKSGGLGLRRLLGINQVFGLKLIWLLFSAEGSLWVAWVKRHLIGDKLFWVDDLGTNGSWVWKELLKLRHIARPFIKCSIVTGKTALFWHDDWNGFGSLLEVVGDNGPLVSGIPIDARVADESVGNLWNLSRSRHPTLMLLKACIPPTPPDFMEEGDDTFFWKTSPLDNSGRFSTSKTWKVLNPAPPPVDWYKSVWFPEKVPKHAFNMWVVYHDRLPTNDRLLAWGLSVSSVCLLCAVHDETSSHLFFSCAYSTQLWQGILSQSGLTPPPPPDFLSVRQWIHNVTQDQKLRTILDLIFQAVTYFIWRERNGRLHQSPSKTPDLIVNEILLLMRAKVAALDRKNTPQSATLITQTSISFLGTWFRFIQPG
ncbi:uncharacterized protein LOC108807663 [Raphanus sativus]|uniref:Uncharacterized protein LOC108807663 n=1 Tax=Raphanus sativus TaxID=3726 RepID=A0A6J0JIF8_RAPSA|nr:uncharacterized protein LOC108807663 [Raphanus sativus]